MGRVSFSPDTVLTIDLFYPSKMAPVALRVMDRLEFELYVGTKRFPSKGDIVDLILRAPCHRHTTTTGSSFTTIFVLSRKNKINNSSTTPAIPAGTSHTLVQLVTALIPSPVV